MLIFWSASGHTWKLLHLLYSYAFLFLQDFMEQFRVLLPKNATACKEDISALLEKKMGLNPTTYQIGKTKVQPVTLL